MNSRSLLYGLMAIAASSECADVTPAGVLSAPPRPESALPPEAGGLRIPDLSALAQPRTFFCVGPACLRSGVGAGVGVGCGLGMGVGFGYPVTAQGSSFDSVGRSPLGQVLSQVPGGYSAIEVLRKMLAQFPNSRVGAGCGVGLGYGAGLGLMWGSGPSEPSSAVAASDTTDDVAARLSALESRVNSLEEQMGLTEKLVHIQESLSRIEGRI